MTPTFLFREQQRFRQRWLLVLVAGVLLLTATVLYFVLQAPVVDWPAVVIVLFPVLLVCLLFAFLRLDTGIAADGIYVRFSPFRRQYTRYAWEDIDNMFIRQYNPLKDYGGWGIRGTGSDRALNVSGNWGLQLILKNKKKLLIGTQHTEALGQLIATLPARQ